MYEKAEVAFKKVISINVNFSGSKFHIFGAIKKHHSQISPIDQPPFDILIEVIGPPIAMDLFKKEKRYGETKHLSR